MEGRPTFLPKLENCPTPITVADGTNFLEAKLSLQGLRTSFDLGPADFLAVFTHDKGAHIEFSTFLGVAHGICRNNFPTKTFEEGNRVSVRKEENYVERLQVGCVDCGADLFGEVISEETGVPKSPAEDVVDEQDSNIFVCSSHIGIIVGQLSLFTHGCSTPLEA